MVNAKTIAASLTEAELVQMVKDWDYLESNQQIGDCLLRSKTECLGIPPSMFVISALGLVSACMRELLSRKGI